MKLPELRRYRTILIQEPDYEYHRWRVRWRRSSDDSLSSTSNWILRRLTFDTSVPVLRQVEHQIHELLHATFPELDEQAVLRGEENICRALEAAGILPKRRRPTNPPKKPGPRRK